MATSAPEPTAARVCEALHEIATAIGGSADAPAIAALVSHQARSLTQADEVVLYIWDREAAVLRLAHGVNTGHEPRKTLSAGEGAIGRAWAAGEPVLVSDYPDWEGAIPELVARGVKRAAAVPLKVSARVVGVLGVRFLGRRGCTPEHVRALQLLATPVAAILDAARARQQAEADEARLAAILDNLPSGVLVRNIAGEIVLMNEAIRGMSQGGFSARLLALDEIEHLEVYEPFTHRRVTRSELPTARALAGERVLGKELRVRLPDSDQDTWVRISAVPLRGSDQTICGAVAVLTDVSRERQLVQTLHTSARENARLVAELQEAQRRHEELLASLRPAESSQTTSAGSALSGREREVLTRLGRGQTNREIGHDLGLSPGTVKKHVEHILRKLGVVDRTRAAVRAIEMGLAERAA